jgi:hypothetical protein
MATSFMKSDDDAQVGDVPTELTDANLKLFLRKIGNSVDEIRQSWDQR